MKCQSLFLYTSDGNIHLAPWCDGEQNLVVKNGYMLSFLKEYINLIVGSPGNYVHETKSNTVIDCH